MAGKIISVVYVRVLSVRVIFSDHWVFPDRKIEEQDFVFLGLQDHGRQYPVREICRLRFSAVGFRIYTTLKTQGEVEAPYILLYYTQKYLLRSEGKSDTYNLVFIQSMAPFFFGQRK